MLYMIMYSIPMIGPKTAKFGQKLAILFLSGQIYAFLVHFGAMPDQKTMGTRYLVDFLICQYKNFCSLSYKLGFGPRNSQICPKISFLVILG